MCAKAASVIICSTRTTRPCGLTSIFQTDWFHGWPEYCNRLPPSGSGYEAVGRPEDDRTAASASPGLTYPAMLPHAPSAKRSEVMSRTRGIICTTPIAATTLAQFYVKGDHDEMAQARRFNPCRAGGTGVDRRHDAAFRIQGSALDHRCSSRGKDLPVAGRSARVEALGDMESARPHNADPVFGCGGRHRREMELAEQD